MPPVTTNSSSANVNGKDGEHHCFLECDELACIPTDKISVRRSNVFPIMEVEYTMLLWPAAPEEDEREHQQSNEENNFCSGKPEFRFAVKADRHEIQPDYHDEDGRNPNCDVDVVGPVVDDLTRGGDFSEP